MVTLCSIVRQSYVTIVAFRVKVPNLKIFKYVLNNIEYGPHQGLSKIRRKRHLRYDFIQYQHGNEALAKMPQIHATFHNALLENFCLVHETSK